MGFDTIEINLVILCNSAILDPKENFIQNFFDLDFFWPNIFGTNVFEQKENQQKHQPQPQF